MERWNPIDKDIEPTEKETFIGCPICNAIVLDLDKHIDKAH